MLSRLLRTISVVCCAIIGVSFVLFVVDEANSASKQDVATLAAEATNSPTPEQQRVRDRAHGAIRRAIDDADDTLLSPFASIVSTHSQWVSRIVPALFGLLVYGVLLGILASFARTGRRPRFTGAGAQGA